MANILIKNIMLFRYIVTSIYIFKLIKFELKNTPIINIKPILSNLVHYKNYFIRINDIETKITGLI